MEKSPLYAKISGPCKTAAKRKFKVWRQVANPSKKCEDK